MQKVSIRTTQNVQLDYPLAGIADRMLAYVIDLFITISFYLIAGLIINQLLGLSLGLLGNSILGIIAYLYRLVLEVLNNGQTIGKMVVQIKVVKLDGSQPSVAAYFLRWLLEPIDFGITGLGIVFIILTKNGQRIGDLISGTTVIKIKTIELTNVQNKIIMDKVDEDYQPVFIQAAEFKDSEIQLIKRSLSAFKNKAHKAPLLKLENKIKEKYEITSDMPTVRFMYTLLRDHAYYVSQ